MYVTGTHFTEGTCSRILVKSTYFFNQDEKSSLDHCKKIQSNLSVDKLLEQHCSACLEIKQIFSSLELNRKWYVKISKDIFAKNAEH